MKELVGMEQNGYSYVGGVDLNKTQVVVFNLTFWFIVFLVAVAAWLLSIHNTSF